MKYVDSAVREIYRGLDGAISPIIYVIDSPEHPFDIAPIAEERQSTLVKLNVSDWNDSLTPWPATGLYRGEPDFKGEAAVTLAEMLQEAIPAVEQVEGLSPAKRAICGYSLGGLFSLYAFTHSGAFEACACLSGSVWYEGWVEHLRNLDFDATGRFAFLSIGSKEKHAARPILHNVQANMEECAAILREHGCETTFKVGPGGHMDHVRERFDSGITALETFLL